MKKSSSLFDMWLKKLSEIKNMYPMIYRMGFPRKKIWNLIFFKNDKKTVTSNFKLRWWARFVGLRPLRDAASWFLLRVRQCGRFGRWPYREIVVVVSLWKFPLNTFIGSSDIRKILIGFRSSGTTVCLRCGLVRRKLLHRLGPWSCVQVATV